MPKLIDLTNQRFGRLVVLHRGDNNNQGKPQWVVKCDCGNVIQVCGTSLKSGNTQSCGCIKSEIVVAKNKENAIHGEAGSRLYRIWIGMKTRCYNPKYNQYKDYGGRGIRICEEWLDFQTFYDWAMMNGYHPNAKRGECTIDRIDVNGNYKPSNCRWVDTQIQNSNMRRNVRYEYRGMSLTIPQFSRKYNISKDVLWRRIHLGWTINKAIETTIRKRVCKQKNSIDYNKKINELVEELKNE